MSRTSSKIRSNTTKGFYKLNNYTPITPGASKVIQFLFEIYHGKDGLESFCTKHGVSALEVQANLKLCNLNAPLCRLFKKVGWFYETKMGYSLYIKYPILVAKHLLLTSMTLQEFAEKYKINKIIVNNFFNETPLLSQRVLDACRKEGVWHECYTKTPLELRDLAREAINNEEGGLASYMLKIRFSHHDSFYDYFICQSTPEKLEQKLKLDGYLIR